FTYIDDGIDALMKIIENPRGVATGQIYNIGNPRNNFSVRQLAEMMVELALEIPEYEKAARKVRLKRTTAESYYGRGYQDMQNRVPKIDNTRRDLHWRPRVGMRDAPHLRGLPHRDRRSPPPGRMKLALKVDVDTWRGTRDGVPRLVELLKRH